MRDITRRFSLPLLGSEPGNGEHDLTLSPSTTFCSPSPVARFSENNLPRLEVETLDVAPFSGSFGALLSNGRKKPRPISMATVNTATDLSYEVECFTDVKELDSQWEDGDIDEILVLSPRSRMSRHLDTITEEQHINDARAIESTNITSFEPLNAEPSMENKIPSKLYRKKDSCRIYCIKTFSSEPNSRSILSITKALSDLKCTFFPEIYWSFESGTDICVVTDYFPRKNLNGLVLSCESFLPETALFYASELLQALEYLHSVHIVHRTLHPNIIMVDADGHIVLAGLGYAQALRQASKPHSREFCSSTDLPESTEIRSFLAPELLLGWSHDFAVDSWGFGMVFAFMLTGKCLFSEISRPRLEESIIWHPAIIDGAIGPQCQDIIAQCLEKSASARANLTRISTHEFFSTVDWTDVSKRRSPAPFPTDPPPCPRSTELDFLNLGVAIQGERDIADATISPKDEQKEALSSSSAVYRTDLLPKVFRASATLNGLPEIPEEEASSSVNHEPTQERCDEPLKDYGPDTPRQHLSAFWDDLDRQVTSSCGTFGLGHVAAIEVHNQDRPNKLRKSRSSGSVYLPRKIFPRFSSTSLNGRLLKRSGQPKDMAASPINNSGRLAPEPMTPESLESSAPERRLPAGVKKMGSGIGFSYCAPTASRSKVSICTTNIPNGCHPILQRRFPGFSWTNLSNFGVAMKRGFVNERRTQTHHHFSSGRHQVPARDASSWLAAGNRVNTARPVTSPQDSVLVISQDCDCFPPQDGSGPLSFESEPATPILSSNGSNQSSPGVLEPGIVMRTEITPHGLPIVPGRKLRDGERITLRLVPSFSRLQVDFQSYDSDLIPPTY